MFVRTYHRLIDIYNNNGTIYDVLSATFYLAALFYYARVRPAKSVGWKSGAILPLLCTASVNSKEMGATLPAMRLVYEALCCRPPRHEWGRRLTRDLAVLWAGLAAMLAAGWIRTHYGTFPGNEAYGMHFGARQLFLNNRKPLDELILRGPRPFFNTALVILWWTLLFVAAALSGKRYLVFAAALVVIAPLPVAFIPTRGFFAVYLSYAGYALFAAPLMAEGRDWLWRHLWSANPSRRVSSNPSGSGRWRSCFSRWRIFTLPIPGVYAMGDSDP